MSFILQTFSEGFWPWLPDSEAPPWFQANLGDATKLGSCLPLRRWQPQDTFLLRDPTKRFEAAAQNWDALFARHGDGDCINIGIFYIKAGPGT